MTLIPLFVYWFLDNTELNRVISSSTIHKNYKSYSKQTEANIKLVFEVAKARVVMSRKNS